LRVDSVELGGLSLCLTLPQNVAYPLLLALLQDYVSLFSESGQSKNKSNIFVPIT